MGEGRAHRPFGGWDRLSVGGWGVGVRGWKEEGLGGGLG